MDALDALNVERTVETFAATHCAVVEGLVTAGERALLRFPLTSANVGRAPLAIGSPAAHPDWFVASPCHGHAHFDGFAAYRLWTPDAYASWTAIRADEPERPASEVLADHPSLASSLVSGRKQGFCLLDSQKVNPLAGGAQYPTCGWQGISPGWADRYDTWLDGQWVDVTGLASGYYVLEAEVNPERRIAESDYADNAAAQLVWVG